VPHRWWEHLLHNKTALYIRTAFLFKPNVVVTTVPFHLGRAVRLRDLLDHDDQIEEFAPGIPVPVPVAVPIQPSAASALAREGA
jgi:hypothetical protein